MRKTWLQHLHPSPSTFTSPQQGAPTLAAIEDKKEDDAPGLSAKEWEQADGLLKKAEAAVEKLKKERERERERERAVARDPFFFFFFNSVSCASIMKDATKLTEKIKHNKDDPLTSKVPPGSFFLL